jgi:hypothetical protein
MEKLISGSNRFLIYFAQRKGDTYSAYLLFPALFIKIDGNNILQSRVCLLCEPDSSQNSTIAHGYMAMYQKMRR